MINLKFFLSTLKFCDLLLSTNSFIKSINKRIKEITH